MLREFKDFLLKGNLIEVAVALVLALALTAVVTSLVEDLITPLIAALFGQPDFAGLTFEINDSVFRYGDFLNARDRVRAHRRRAVLLRGQAGEHARGAPEEGRGPDHARVPRVPQRDPGRGAAVRLLHQRGGGTRLNAPLEVGAVDYHTAGEPFRIVTGGVPSLGGSTILEKRRFAAEQLDHVRRLLVFEPRGHADMYGCFVTEPEDEGADLGVVFFHNAGYSTACGHGTIALVTWALETGVLPVEEPETRVVVDVPSGRLETVARVAGGAVVSVRFRNVPSYVEAEGLIAEGLRADVAFGGAFYASVASPLPVSPRNLPELIELGRAVKAGLEGQRPFVHPRSTSCGTSTGSSSGSGSTSARPCASAT